MSPFDDVASNLVRRWVRFYTGRLDPAIRDARRAEIESDLWEHRREAGLANLRPGQTGLEIVARWLLGIPADLTWRRGVPRTGRARDGGGVMSVRSSGNWWIVPALVLAGLHLFVGVANLDPGWAPPQPQVDPMAVLIVVFGVAAGIGVALRNRAPKLGSLLVLSGVWVPLLAPVYNSIVRIFDLTQPVVSGPSEYGGAFGVVIAVLTALGAIQNMARRPITPRAPGRLAPG